MLFGLSTRAEGPRLGTSNCSRHTRREAQGGSCVVFRAQPPQAGREAADNAI